MSPALSICLLICQYRYVIISMSQLSTPREQLLWRQVHFLSLRLRVPNAHYTAAAILAIKINLNTFPLGGYVYAQVAIGCYLRTNDEI